MNARLFLVCKERISLTLHIAKKSREHTAKIKLNVKTGAFNDTI